MEKYKIIGVEGNIRSGKTTLIAGLNHLYGYPMVKEYGPYVGGAQNLPSFPPDNHSQAKGAIDFLLDIERKRSADALNLFKKKGEAVLTDRSPFSCLVFQRYVRDCMIGVPNAYDYTVDTFARALSDSEIILPNALIYLRPTLDIFKDRVARCGRVKIDFHNDPSTWIYNNQWYRALLEVSYPNNSGQLIESREGSQKENVQQAHTFIENANYLTDPMKIFQSASEIKLRL